MEYRAIFEDLTGTEQEPQENKKKDTSAIIDKGSSLDLKQVGKVVTTGTAILAIGSQIYAKQESTSNTISGNSIAQIHLNNQMAYFNEGLKLFGTLGVAALVNPATIPVAVTGLAISYGLRAYDVSNQNQIKQANWQVERIVNADLQSRLVQNVAYDRI